ncbi:MAG: hypothetical protein ACRDWD_06720 [Acidimicrobiia bacterium]
MAASACGGDRPAPATPTEAAAAEFALARFGEWDRQEFAKAWTHLHPAQQAIVPRDQFTWCYAERNGDPGIKNFGLSGEITHTTVRIPGTRLDADATIVPIELVSESGDGDITDLRQVPVIRVKGRWTWILPRGYPRDFRRIGCVGRGTPFGSEV